MKKGCLLLGATICLRHLGGPRCHLLLGGQEVLSAPELLLEAHVVHFLHPLPLPETRLGADFSFQAISVCRRVSLPHREPLEEIETKPCCGDVLL